MIGLSLYATNISISSIIGLAGSGYETGISVFNYEWTGTVMLVFFAILIVPYYLRHRLVTMPEFLERRFDHRSRLYFSVISILVNVLIDIAGALYACSILLKGIFPEIELYIFVIALAIATGVYTVVGGLQAVVLTDAIQAILLTLAAAIISFVAFQEIGSWQEVQSALDPQFLKLIQPMDDELIPWPTLLVSLPILGFYFICTNQHMVQRILGAKSTSDGIKGAMFAGVLKLPLLFILVMPGTFGRILYPELESANLVFPQLMFDFLPAGVLGLVLTGFVAALMSSIDSALTAASSIATMDIYKKIRPTSSQKHLIKAGKVFILLAVFIASLWAPFIDQFPTLWEYLQAVLSYLSPPIVTCFVFGLFWKKATSSAAVWALAIGSLAGILLIINNYIFLVIGSIHYLYSATIIFLISSLTIILTSYVTKESKVTPISIGNWRKTIGVFQKKQHALPWYNRNETFAFIVLFLTAILVFLFW